MILSGNGDFTIGDSLIDAETLIIKSNGFVDLSVSDIRADKVVFSQGASVTMLGTTIIAKTICGYLRGTYASGVKMIAQDQISLNLINADLQGATLRTDTFGPGTMENATLYPYTKIDCRKNLADFSGSVGHPEGHCPEPDKGNPTFICEE